MSPLPFLLCSLVVFLSSPSALSENWPQFRGPNGQGHSSETDLPTRWSRDENIAWFAPVPGDAWSSPIVWGNHVFVTTATEGGASCRVIAIDRLDGSILWDREVFRQETLRKERRNTYATPTPTTDGSRVYATFAAGGIAALSFSGEILWTNMDYPFYSQHGLGASPIVHDGRLILCHDGSSRGPDTKVGWQTPWDQSFVFALDTETGDQVWKTGRGLSRISHGSPAIWEPKSGAAQIVSEAGDVIQGFDSASGRLIWSAEVRGEGKVPSVTLGDSMVYTAGGWDGKETIKGFTLGGEGQLGETNLVWEQRKNMPKVPSMLLLDSGLFAVTDGGIAALMDEDTGELIYQERVGAACAASPLAADGRIYLVSDRGETVILSAGPTFDIIARNPLEESVQATPAISQGSLFIRTENGVYRIDANN